MSIVPNKYIKTAKKKIEMNSTEYKNYHESFMQNNQGSTAVHTFLCVFFTVQCSLYCAIKQNLTNSSQYISEYLIIVLPTILAHTVLSSYIYELNVCISVLLVFKVINKFTFKDIHDALARKNTLTNKKVQSITCLRGLTYLITAICILAVDFKDFPRYLAKTEKYGYSLMDTGVGLFVLISGLVHRDFNKSNYVSVIKSNTKFVCVLVILGLTRYLSIKQLDYQTHVTEYGVHWNFFYTLAVCKFLSSLILLWSSNPTLLSIIVIIIHEFLLCNGLEAWVFSDTPRSDLIDANKEGITSSLGYVALYLFAVNIKQLFSNKSVSRYDILQTLIILSVILITGSYVVNLYRPASRTLANTGYCMFLSAITVFVLSIMNFLEVLFDSTSIGFNVPLILVAINHNGLLYFLIANIATGIINMSVRTLFVPTIATLIILNLYMTLTLYITVYINKKGIKL